MNRSIIRLLKTRNRRPTAEAHNQLSPYIQETRQNGNIVLTLPLKSVVFDDEKALKALFEKVKEYQKQDGESVSLDLALYVGANWPTLLKEMNSSYEYLPKIDQIYFSDTSFSVGKLKDIYSLYEECSKKNIIVPILMVHRTPIHEMYLAAQGKTDSLFEQRMRRRIHEMNQKKIYFKPRPNAGVQLKDSSLEDLFDSYLEHKSSRQVLSKEEFLSNFSGPYAKTFLEKVYVDGGKSLAEL